jgi:formamidopyrimidine-DNA glycosylase
VHVPEVAEVEVVRRGLEPLVVGKRVTRVVLSDENERWSEARESEGALVLGVRRRGKYVLLDLAKDAGEDPLAEMVVHLGMTGQLVTSSEEDVMTRFRVRWHLEGGVVLNLGDVRGFGRVAVLEPGEHSRIAGLAGLGPEPLGGFDERAFARELTKSGAPVKAVLLGQSLMAGVGNYVADEGLWRARVHPEERHLGVRRGAALGRALVDVVEDALVRGGLSIRDYVRVDGTKGSMQDALSAYGRAGLPCLRCGSALRKSVVAGRGSTWCPKCQALR